MVFLEHRSSEVLLWHEHMENGEISRKDGAFWCVQECIKRAKKSCGGKTIVRDSVFGLQDRKKRFIFFLHARSCSASEVNQKSFGTQTESRSYSIFGLINQWRLYRFLEMIKFGLRGQKWSALAKRKCKLAEICSDTHRPAVFRADIRAASAKCHHRGCVGRIFVHSSSDLVFSFC